MEAILIVEGVGAYKSFEEIEDSLTLDELLFLHKHLMRSKQTHYRMLAAFQGVDLGDADEFEDSENDLPDEVIAAERAWQERKKAAIESNSELGNEMSEFGLGYSKK